MWQLYMPTCCIGFLKLLTILWIMFRQLLDWEEGKSKSCNKLKTPLPQCTQGVIDPNINITQHCTTWGPLSKFLNFLRNLKVDVATRELNSNCLHMHSCQRFHQNQLENLLRKYTSKRAYFISTIHVYLPLHVY